MVADTDQWICLTVCKHQVPYNVTWGVTLTYVDPRGKKELDPNFSISNMLNWEKEIIDISTTTNVTIVSAIIGLERKWSIAADHRKGE